MKRFIYNCQVFKNAIINSKLHILFKEYLLANAKYYNTDFGFELYYKVCYYLKKLIIVNFWFENKIKLFNLHQSSLQNII